MERDRIIEEILRTDPEVRSEENLKEIRESARMGEEEYPAIMYRNIRITESLRLQQKEQKTLLSEFAARGKETFRRMFGEYLATRNTIFEDLKNQGDKFRAILDLILA